MTIDPPLTVTCSVTERDYVSAHFVHLRPRPWLKVVGWALIFLVLVALGFTLYQMRYHGLSNPPFWIIFSCCTYLLLSFLVWRPYRLRRLYRQHAHPGRPYILVADDSALEMRWENGQGRVPWSDFRKWKEGESVFLLYHTDVLFHIVPKQCLSSEQVAGLRQILSNNVRRAE